MRHLRRRGNRVGRYGGAAQARSKVLLHIPFGAFGDNGSGDQVPAPPQPPSHPAQVSMKAADWTLEHSPSPSQITTDWLLRHTRPSPDTRLSHPSPDPQGAGRCRWILS
jgi:hypothetical protein